MTAEPELPVLSGVSIFRMGRIILVLSGFLLAAGCFAETPVTGGWAGSIQFSGKALPLQIQLAQKDGGLTGKATLITEHLVDQPLTSVNSRSGSIHFELKAGAGTWVFEGKKQDRILRGDLTAGEATGTFELIHIATVDAGTYRKYFGTYELDSNRFLYIRTWDELGENTLTYFDSTGAVGALLPSSSTEFFSGPSILLPAPAESEIRFGMKSGKPGLWWKEDGKERFARRIQSFTEEEVRIQNGSVTLGASLVVPITPGPHPAVVLVHGSSSVTRDFFGPIAYLLAQKGIAVLSYDKRGVGASTGHWMDGNFQDLAGDALAAVQFMKSRKDIDPSTIGLLGISQGGWIAPLAASQSKDVAFLVLVSAAFVSPAEQIVQSQEAELRVMRVGEEEIAEASAKVRSQLDWLRSDQALKELEPQLDQLRRQPDAKLYSEQGLENPRYLLWLRRVMDYDPVPALQKTSCPVLLIYGELDRTVPMLLNKEPLERALKDAGNQDVKSEVFPNSNHALLRCTSGGNAEFPYLKEFAAGFFDTMTGWILNQKKNPS